MADSMEHGISELFSASREFLANYGYFSIFGLLLLETTLFIGFAVPGVIVLVLAGYAASSGVLSPTIVIGVSILGVISGDNASFALGRLLGKKVIRFPNETQKSANKNWWILLFFHHVPLSRMFIPAFFGMSKGMSFYIWLLLDFISAVIFVLTYFCIGYLAHFYTSEIEKIYSDINTYVLTLGLIIFSAWVYKVYHDKT